jgi:hypothetical protein
VQAEDAHEPGGRGHRRDGGLRPAHQARTTSVRAGSGARSSPPKAASTWSAASSAPARRLPAATDAGIRVSLFIDAELPQIDAARECGVPAIEIHTGRYAEADRADAEIGAG